MNSFAIKSANPLKYLFRRAGAEIVYNKLIGPYLAKTHTKVTLAATTALNGGMVAGGVYFNYLFRDIYNHLAARDWSSFTGDFIPMGTAIGVVLGVHLTHSLLSQNLKLAWGNWAARQASEDWLRPENQSKLVVHSVDLEPEQRITIDVGKVVNGTHYLAFDVLSTVANFGAFSVVLFSISPKLFVGTMAMGAAGSWIVYKAGRNLNALTDEFTHKQNAYRTSMVRAKDNLLSIASWRGEHATLKKIDTYLEAVNQVCSRTIKNNIVVDGLRTLYINVAGIIPFWIIAPAYFKPGSKLGIGDANLSVTSSYTLRYSLDWYARNQQMVIDLTQAARRVTQFLNACQPNRELEHKFPTIQCGGGTMLDVKNLRLCAPQNGSSEKHVLCDDIRFDNPLYAGDRFLLKGPSGCGKTTFYNILAGNKPHETGEIIYSGIKDRAETIFVPQQPYMPDGTFREVLLFPNAEAHFSDEELALVLEKVGLENKIQLIGNNQLKGSELGLSGGELQRLNFARLLLHKPKIIGLDEATSALPVCDQPGVINARGLHELLFRELPQSIVISITHQEALTDLHNVEGTFADRNLTIIRHEPKHDLLEAFSKLRANRHRFNQ